MTTTLGAWLLAVLAASSSPVASFVVVVGVNEGIGGELATLQFADDDAVRFHRLLGATAHRASLLTNLDADSQRLYPELAAIASPPTSENLFATLHNFYTEMEALREAGRETALYFVFSGHGTTDASRMGYIHLQDIKLSREAFYERVIEPCPAQAVHVIIDACSSYFLLNRGDDSREIERALANYLAEDELARFPQVGMILSTSGDNDSREWKRYRAGIVSHQIRSAMLGAGDVNGDGHVEYGEVAAFIAAANQTIEHADARPNVHVRPPSRNLTAPLFRPRELEGYRWLEINAAVVVRAYLESETGVRWLDLNKAAGWRMAVAVPKAEPFVVVNHSVQSFVEAGTEVLAWADLEWEASEIQHRGSLERAFKRALFETPFGPVFYDGYAAAAGFPRLARVPFHLDTIDEGEAGGVRLTWEPEAAVEVTTSRLGLAGPAAGPCAGVAMWVNGVAFAVLQVATRASEHRFGQTGYTLYDLSVRGGGGVQLFTLGPVRLTARLLAGTYQLLQAAGATGRASDLGFVASPAATLTWMPVAWIGIDVRGGVELVWSNLAPSSPDALGVLAVGLRLRLGEDFF